MRELLKLAMNENVRVIFKRDVVSPGVLIVIIYNYPDSTKTLYAQRLVTDAFIEYTDDNIHHKVIMEQIHQFRNAVEQQGFKLQY